MTDISGDNVFLSSAVEVTAVDGSTSVFLRNSHVHTETRNGWWKRRRPKGAGRVGFIPPTNYLLVRNTISSNIDGFFEQKYLSGGKWRTTALYRGNVLGMDMANGWQSASNGYPARGVPQSLIDQAITKARLALKDQKVNLAVAFAERDSTARMIGDNARAIADAVRHLRKGRFKRAARSLGIAKPGKPRGKEVTSRWLELQYGWKPLLQDVYGATEALARRNEHDWLVSAKGSARESIDETINVSKSSPRIIRGTLQTRGHRGVFARIDAIPRDGLLKSFSATGITNPATVAWELVPFSFVVDWFLPVGDYIDSMDALIGFKRSWCSVTTIEKFDSRFVGNPKEQFTSSGMLNEVTRSASQHRKYIKMVRTVYDDSVPIPVLPRFKNPVSLGHMANGLSLLASAFGR